MNNSKPRQSRFYIWLTVSFIILLHVLGYGSHAVHAAELPLLDLAAQLQG